MTECGWCGYPVLRSAAHADFCPTVNAEMAAVLNPSVDVIDTELPFGALTGTALAAVIRYARRHDLTARAAWEDPTHRSRIRAAS